MVLNVRGEFSFGDNFARIWRGELREPFLSNNRNEFEGSLSSPLQDLLLGNTPYLGSGKRLDQLMKLVSLA
jgi:hypothetical protein